MRESELKAGKALHIASKVAQTFLIGKGSNSQHDIMTYQSFILPMFLHFAIDID